MMKENIKIFQPQQDQEQYIHFTESLIKAGFPSPAQDYSELKLDLNKELIKNPSATFFARVSGESMIEDGVGDGDILVVDRSVEPSEGSLAVCYLNGEFTLKRIKISGNIIYLVPANSNFEPIRVDHQEEFAVWGVVRYIIKKV